MKELYIIASSYNPTSAGINRLLAFGLALTKLGIKVTYFYLFPYHNKEKCTRYLDKLNYVYLWENSPFSNKYLNTIRSLREFYKHMRHDIPVYAYGSLNCIYFLRKKKGIRLYHEYTENPEVIGKIGGRIGNYLYNLYKKTIPKLDGIFLITPALREKYINEFDADPKKTILLNMIVDKDRFENLKETNPEKCISYCGIISEFKDGVSILIKAFHKVSLIHHDFKLRLIGPFRDHQTELKLKLLVKELDITDKVIFEGIVSPLEMPEILKKSSILALARPDNIQSKYGFATKIGEYLMTGRPTVLTRVGAVEEYLETNVNCILAQPDNVDDFANKLLWAIENYEQAAIIGLRGKETALKCFNSELEATKIYDQIK